MNFKISPVYVFKILLGIIVVLVIVSTISNVLEFTYNNGYTDFLRTLFNVDFENNIPTYYSATVLFLCSIILFLIAKSSNDKRFAFLPWFFLGLIFLFLSIDETSQIHEKLIRSLRARWNLQGYLYSGWIIPYGIAVVGLFMVFSKFLWELPKKTRNLMILSGVIFVFGGIVMEMISVNIGFAHERNDKSAAYLITMTLEELFEMLGGALFTFTLLDYSIAKFGAVKLKIMKENNNID